MRVLGAGEVSVVIPAERSESEDLVQCERRNTVPGRALRARDDEWRAYRNAPQNLWIRAQASSRSSSLVA